MTRSDIALVLAGLLATGGLLHAQAPTPPRGNEHVSAGDRPPPGMCRIWIDGVPAEHQPAPTDCATAIRRRPNNARVLFGDTARATATRLPGPIMPTPHFAPPARVGAERDSGGRPPDKKPGSEKPRKPDIIRLIRHQLSPDRPAL
ncbi:MAG: hypothetical protein M3068_09295 [Gemmatimonadota bacterium]|nr:hypothetical protein [Gemmatimonadota bacterium]